MSVFAVTMVRDEADVIAGTLLHLAEEGVDAFIVADNNSTDDTRKIVEDVRDEYDLDLTLVDDPEIGYYQSRKMSALAEMAGLRGATWIVPFDADEVWVFRGSRLGSELAARHVDIVTADLFQHFPTAVDPPGDDPFATIQWRQPDPAPLPKVAFRWRPGAVVHQGNHGVTLPGSRTRSGVGLEVRHFPYRSPEQFVRKARNGAAAYRATDLAANIGAHWRSYGDLLDRFGEEALHDVFRTHFWFLSPTDNGLIPDAAPYLRWRVQ